MSERDVSNSYVPNIPNSPTSQHSTFPVLDVGGVDCRYRFGAVKMALRAMSTSSKVSVRTDGEGVLNLNFMVEVEGKNVFVDFRVRSFLRGLT